MRISDWSSDVCSSDLAGVFGYLNSKKDAQNAPTPRKPAEIIKFDEPDDTWVKTGGLWTNCVFVGPENCSVSPVGIALDWKSVVSGKSVSVRVDLGGGRILNKTIT